VFSVESWTLSQAYYFGKVDDNRSHRCEISFGECINENDRLYLTALGKPGFVHDPHPKGIPGFQPHLVRSGPDAGINGYANAHINERGTLDEGAMLADIVSGVSFHTSSVRLVGRWARSGVPYLDARQRLFDAFGACTEEMKATQRWLDRSKPEEIDRTLDFVYIREAEKRDASELQSGRTDDAPSNLDGQDEGEKHRRLDRSQDLKSLASLTVLTPTQIEQEPTRLYLIKGLISQGDHAIASLAMPLPLTSSAPPFRSSR